MDDLSEQLSHTGLTNSSCSFKDKGLKVDNAEQAKNVANKIAECVGLECLEFTGNTFGIDAADAIADSLKSCSNLKRLLWSDMFTGRLKSEIPAFLQSLCSSIQYAKCQLTEIDLSDNAIGPNGMEGLKSFLETEPVWSLEVLKLNNTGLGVTGTKMLAKSLMTARLRSEEAGRPMRLKVFVAGRSRIENEGAEALAQVFSKYDSLERLEMPQNGIRPPGIAHLAEAISHNPHMRLLNLSDNSFQKAGGESVGKILPRLSELEIVNFEDCLLKSAGAKAILKGLIPLQSLRILNLAGNEIQADVAGLLNEVLVNKPHLTSVDLNGNRFGSGLDAIRDAFSGAKNDQFQLAPLSDDEGSEVTDDEAENGEAEDEQSEDEQVEPECDRSPFSGGAALENTTVKHEVHVNVPVKHEIRVNGHVTHNADDSAVAQLGDEIDNAERVGSKVIELCGRVTPGNLDATLWQVTQQCRELLTRHFETGDMAPVNFVNIFVPQLNLMKREKGTESGLAQPVNRFGVLKVLAQLAGCMPGNVKNVIAFIVDMNQGTIGNLEAVQELLRAYRV